jgi:hypothetical protein
MLDLLAYRRAYAPALDAQTEPYGLGYAWGSELVPASEAEVTLCTPDTLARARTPSRLSSFKEVSDPVWGVVAKRPNAADAAPASRALSANSSATRARLRQQAR